MPEATHKHINGGPLDYHLIIDGIFAGTNQCCAMGLVEVLKKEGVTVDISLEDIKLDHPFGVEAYLWLPTPENHPFTEDQLNFGASALERFVERRKKVYLHCRNGHGRTSTMLGAYLIHKGYSVQDALALIKSKRPSIHLQDSQIESLNRYAESRGTKR